ncbi:MAG: response regulator receiver protein [Candidatus Sulfotelmatobacter sp.]|nr:response regulator receiver protein [Candidatus Sulfotelmatobacter sp.]
MAAPVKVPIAQTVLLTNDDPQPTSTESVAAILKRSKVTLIADWLARTKRTPELNHLHLSDDQRTGHLPKLVDDVTVRLGRTELPTQDSDAAVSLAAIAHGKLRRKQGYSAAMLIHESRILQVTIFGTLHKNLGVLDFRLLLPDVMTIADEVDAQLTQTMESFSKTTLKPAIA